VASEPDVDRVPGDVKRGVRCGDPSCSFLFRAVLGDGLAKQLILVRRGTSAAVDGELDPVVCGIRCSLAEGIEESEIEVGHGRNVVVEDRHAVRDGTVSLAKCTILVAVRSVDGWWTVTWRGKPPHVTCLPGHRFWTRCWNGSRAGIECC
jgi:hypothetical protein